MTPRLSALLVQDRVVSFRQMDAAVQRQRRYGGRIGTNLLELGSIDEATLNRYLAIQQSNTCVTGDALACAEQSVVTLLPQERAIELGILPLRRVDGRIQVLAVDPLDIETWDGLRVEIGEDIEPVAVSEFRFWHILNALLGVELPERYHELVANHPLEIRFRESRRHPPVSVETPTWPADGETPGLTWSIAQLAAFYRASESRDQLLLSTLGFVGKFFSRRAMVIVARSGLVGAIAQGFGDQDGDISHVRLTVDEDSPLWPLCMGESYFLGRVDEIELSPFYDALGLPHPTECMVLPIKVGPRAAVLLVGDHEDRVLDHRVLAICFVIAAQLSGALERLIRDMKERRSGLQRAVATTAGPSEPLAPERAERVALEGSRILSAVSDATTDASRGVHQLPSEGWDLPDLDQIMARTLQMKALDASAPATINQPNSPDQHGSPDDIGSGPESAERTATHAGTESQTPMGSKADDAADADAVSASAEPRAEEATAVESGDPSNDESRQTVTEALVSVATDALNAIAVDAGWDLPPDFSLDPTLPQPPIETASSDAPDQSGSGDTSESRTQSDTGAVAAQGPAPPVATNSPEVHTADTIEAAPIAQTETHAVTNGGPEENASYGDDAQQASEGAEDAERTNDPSETGAAATRPQAAIARPSHLEPDAPSVDSTFSPAVLAAAASAAREANASSTSAPLSSSAREPERSTTSPMAPVGGTRDFTTAPQSAVDEPVSDSASALSWDPSGGDDPARPPARGRQPLRTPIVLDVAIPGVLQPPMLKEPQSDDERAIRAEIASARPERLVSLLRDDRRFVRDSAFVALLDHGESAWPAVLDSFPYPLTTTRRDAVRDGVPLESHGPIVWLAALQGAALLDALVPMVSHEAADTRFYALQLVIRAGAPDAASLAINRLLDRDEQIRDFALRFIEQGRNPELTLAAAAFSRRGLSANEPWRVDIAISLAAHFRDADAAPILIGLLDHDSDRTRHRAANALTRLSFMPFGTHRRKWEKWYRRAGAADARQWLLDAMVSRDRRVRELVGRELRQSTRFVVNYDPDFSSRQLKVAQRSVETYFDAHPDLRASFL